MSTDTFMRVNGLAVDVTCMKCGQLITSNGRVWINMSDVSKVETAMQKYEGKTSFTGDELLSMPEEAHWQAHHAACDPAPDVSAYEI